MPCRDECKTCWSAQGQGWFQAPWGLTQSLALAQVHKLLVVVELLLGEIPDRLQFRQPSLKRSLMPYFLLTQGMTAYPCLSLSFLQW